MYLRTQVRLAPEPGVQYGVYVLTIRVRIWARIRVRVTVVSTRRDGGSSGCISIRATMKAMVECSYRVGATVRAGAEAGAGEGAGVGTRAELGVG